MNRIPDALMWISGITHALVVTLRALGIIVACYAVSYDIYYHKVDILFK